MATSFTRRRARRRGSRRRRHHARRQRVCTGTCRPGDRPDPRRAGRAADLRAPDRREGLSACTGSERHGAGEWWTRLNLDPAVVRQARELAARAGQPIVEMARTHTTVSVERAVLRLAGLHGADPDGMPWVNRLVDAVPRPPAWSTAWRCPPGDALLTGGYDDLAALAEAARQRQGAVPHPGGRRRRGRPGGRRSRALATGIARIDATACGAQRMIAETADPRKPWIYLIVATGDIYEDIPQAQAAAREGADIIAVIRSTGQSLLDYVPEGATREGFAGTYATQENFRLMRAALDDDSRELGRYVRLDQLRLGAVHARDRVAGRARAPRHDAERLHVRDHLPRHQPPPYVHRPAILPADPRPRRDHHQHRRGQLPDHRRRGGRRAHGRGQPAAQRVLRQGGRPGRRAARPRPRVRDQPRGAGLVPARAGARPARPRVVSRCAAEVHAADQAHDRQRVRRVPAGRVLQPVRAS